MRQRTWQLSLLLALQASWLACAQPRDTEDRRSSGDQPGEQARTPGTTPGTDTPGATTDSPSGGQAAKDDVSSVVYDAHASHAVALNFYQAAPALKDLFATNGTSQLCFPAALSYSMEYQRSYRQPALSALPDVSESKGASAVVRHFTTACKTDKSVGTTVLQGVSCIDEHYKAASLTPHIAVSGVDASWGRFGIYPKGVEARTGSITPDGLRKDVDADAGVILLIGFYKYDSETRTYKRERGHFVSLTGYGWDQEWGARELSLQIVNPGVDYSRRGDKDDFDRVRMVKVEKAESRKYPADVDYEVLGKGISDTGLRAFLETAITFDAGR